MSTLEDCILKEARSKTGERGLLLTQSTVARLILACDSLSLLLPSPSSTASPASRPMAFRLEAGMAVAPSDKTAGSQADGTYTLFFFGTLVHPAILSNVIKNDGSHLSVQPAILPGYVVHHIVNEDYPALLAREQSDILMKSGQINHEDRVIVADAVRGTVVRGLSALDVLKLDTFEGDEYVRIGTKVRPDPSVPAMSNDRRPRDESIGQILSTLNAAKIAHLIATVSEEAANVYLWRASVEMLEPRIWDFADFASSGKDRKWYS